MQKEIDFGYQSWQEVDSFLEKYRKEILEQYLEFGLVMLNKFQSQGMTLDDVIEKVKVTLWYVKNERMSHIVEECGL